MSDNLVREKLRLYADDVAPAQLPSFGGVSVRRRRRRAQRALASAAVVVAVVAAVFAGFLVQGSMSRTAVRPVAPASPSATVAPAPVESPPTGVTSQLVGTTWQLGSWSFNRASHTVGDEVTLEFSTDGGNVQLDAGCNKPSATATYDGATIRLTSVAGALSCPQQNVGLLSAYQRLESGPIAVTVTPDRLTLAGTGVVLELSSTSASVAATPELPWQKGLEGTLWQLLTVDGPGAGPTGHWAVPADSGTLAFGARAWDASDTCNDHTGSLLYGAGSATGGTLLMAPGASSVVLCEKPLVQRLERLERTDLIGSVTVALSGKRLTMHSGQDTLVFAQGASGPASAQVPASAGNLTQLLTLWTWQVQSWSVNGTTWSVDPNAAQPSTLLFDYSTAKSSGCGAMIAAVAYRDSSVVFSGGVIPTILCGPLASSPQNAFAQLFSGGAEVSVSGTTLTLAGNGLVMTFTAGASRYPS